MNAGYILKEVESVTKIAKNIFGDIVHKVYFSSEFYGSEDETISRIDRDINSGFNRDDCIDQDCKTIVIEFVNGKKVVFSNSEWGSMEAFNDSEVKKYVWRRRW